MRILVVGLGSMGRRRLRNLALIGGQETAGFEPAEARRQEVGAEFGIPTFADFEEAVSAWKPQALVISTPPDHHSEYALAALRRGIHYFTEASVVPEGVDELIVQARGARSLACPSCTLRFHPSVRLLRQRIAAGAIGKPLAFTHHTGQYLPDWHPWEDYRKFYVSRRETGAAREIVPFELIWQTYLFGAVRRVSGFAAKVSDLEADIDDIYSCLLRFESGVQGSLVVDVIARPAVRQARILGSEGTLIWDWTARVVREWTAEAGRWTEYPEPPPVKGPGGDWVAENMYIEEMRGYLDAIEGRAPWPYSLEEDKAILGRLLDVEASSREHVHRAVR